MSNLQHAKTGDTLLLSGQLNERTPLEDSEWIGATGAVNVWLLEAPHTLLVDHGVATLTTDVTPKRYSYVGDEIPEGSEGMYQYEVEVNHATIGPRTYPNDRTRYRLEITAQGA